MDNFSLDNAGAGARRVALAHGSGGYESAALMRDVFAKHFANPVLSRMEDAAAIDTHGRIAVSTDTFVVRPLFFPGGDIGKLAVCGTVNDVLMSGALPRYLTCGFVIEAGLPFATLDRVCASMADAAKAAGAIIVAGDTKVVEARGGESELFINTTGIGVFGDAGGGGIPYTPCAPSGVMPGDRLIVSGNLGDHHACILSARMGIQNGIESDCALLSPITEALRAAGVPVHAMRDITRGGLGTVLNELAAASGVRVEIDEDEIPASPGVRAFCGVLGLDPMYMGNEGKLVLAVSADDAARALAAVRGAALGADARVIGEALPGGTGPLVAKRTAIGGRSRVDPLFGEGLPRIC